MIATLIATLMTTPIYRSSLLMQIERESDKVLEYESLTPAESSNTKDFYQTQYELLQSRSLARRVIDQLALETSKTLNSGAEDSLTSRFFERITGFFSDGATEETDYSVQELEDSFLENLSVEPIKNSRLVRLHYDSVDPKEAANILNSLAEVFVSITLERKFDASSYAKDFLEERIIQVRASLEDSERKLIDYAREREIVNLDDKQAILMDRFKEMSRELVQVEAQRIRIEAEYQQAMNSGQASLSKILDSPVIQALKAQQSALESEYEELLKVFKPAYPKMQQLQSQIDEVKQEISNEIGHIQQAIRLDYEAALSQEQKIKSHLEEIKGQYLDLQDRTTDYQALKREVDTNRELYDGLLQRMKEVGVTAGIGTNNIAIVDPAEIPRKKFKPQVLFNLTIALAGGLFLGMLLAFLFETLDDTIKSGQVLEQKVRIASLGIVPKMPSSSGNIALLAYEDPKSAMAEAYRSLRTSLIFSTSEGAPKIMHFTSSQASEGKTTSAISTAVTFAQTGGTVLLVDADLRNPSLHKEFNLPNTKGLTNHLTGAAEPAEIAQASVVQRLFVTTSGPIPPNPAELLSSGQMMDFVSLAAERFDYVVIDGPPVLGLADALVLGNMAQATIFVVKAGHTRVGAVEGSLKRLRHAKARVLGALLTHYGHGGSGYGYDYEYSYKYYSYQSEDSELSSQKSPAA
jgi:capsular exopolysaccharide synthesis family protein